VQLFDIYWTIWNKNKWQQFTKDNEKIPSFVWLSQLFYFRCRAIFRSYIWQQFFRNLRKKKVAWDLVKEIYKRWYAICEHRNEASAFRLLLKFKLQAALSRKGVEILQKYDQNITLSSGKSAEAPRAENLRRPLFKCHSRRWFHLFSRRRFETQNALISCHAFAFSLLFVLAKTHSSSDMMSNFWLEKYVLISMLKHGLVSFRETGKARLISLIFMKGHR
jgi:hypothetical protein